MINKYLIIIWLLLLVLFSACTDDGFSDTQVVGLWKQVALTADGEALALSAEQQNCKLLIEPNGICRYYHAVFENFNQGAGPTSFYGTWSIIDGRWINFTTDKWQFVPALTSDSNKVSLTYTEGGIVDTIGNVRKQWNKYHIQSRFSILKLSDSELEIRIKTFVGEKKYALLFAPDAGDFIDVTASGSAVTSFSPKLITDDNYWNVKKEFQTLKTYVFTFKREDY